MASFSAAATLSDVDKKSLPTNSSSINSKSASLEVIFGSPVAAIISANNCSLDTFPTALGSTPPTAPTEPAATAWLGCSVGVAPWV